jgi:aryl-alcohol dehydrogenase-like predicted oxidoreductase
MRYRTLGRTGCVVSTLGLGTMTFGKETDEAGAFAQLDLFAEQGGTLINSADVYGGTASESIIGRWLADRPADVTDAMVVSTKGRFPATAVFDAQGTSRRHLRRALEASLRRLGRDHIDLYMVHAWDPITPLEETLRFLDDAVRGGLIAYPGVSNFLGWQIQKAAGLARELGTAPIVALEPSYSLLVREIEFEIVPACLDAGVGMLPWSPLGGGWLSGKYTRDQAPSGATRLGEDPNRGIENYAGRAGDEHTWRTLGAVQDVAEALGASMAQVALAWVEAQPAVSSVLMGCRTIEQLRDNLGAADLLLDQTHLDRLNEASAPKVGDYPYGGPGIDQRTRTLP